MSNSLIASLGKSPIVATAMVKAIHEKKNVLFDEVVLLYPEKQLDVQIGIELIEHHCLCKKIVKQPLGFDDANSEDRCMFFLQTLYGVLEDRRGCDVWLSIAGGRKSMSALMYPLAPFYPNIKGVCHILDKHEGTDNTCFHDLDDLIEAFNPDDSDNPELASIMNPPLDNLSLVEIPFESFVNADNLRKLFKEIDFQALDDVPVDLAPLDSDAGEFWNLLFRKEKFPNRNAIWFSETAKKQFENPNINRMNFARYFADSKLKNPSWANKVGKNGGKHPPILKGKDANIHFFTAKISRTAERVIWREHPPSDVVISELGVENDRGQYKRVGGSIMLNQDFFSTKSVSDYPAKHMLRELPYFGKAVLVATLGKSPMVVTQAVALLEHFENVKIDKVALAHPKLNPDVRNGFDMLKEVFEKKRIDVIDVGMDMDDVDDEEKCKFFLTRLIEVVGNLKNNHPDLDIRMLLSGGRKGMSTLSLLAAQCSGVKNVYHTLITSLELEERLEKEGSLDLLKNLKSKKERAMVLFLENHIKLLDNHFALFKIPVIPLRVPYMAST